MRIPNQKILAGTLAAVLLCEAAGLPLAEANVWQERREKSVQLASLPSAVVPSFSMPAVPTLDKHLTDVAIGSLPNEIAPLLTAISRHNATIKEVYLNPKRGPFVLLIQDVHLNFEAQKNIADILASIVAVKPVLIGLEGLFGDTHYDRFGAFSDKTIAKAVAEFLLKENKISGDAYAAAVLTSPARFLGVDDPVAYQTNVRAVQETAGFKKDTRQRVEKELRRLATEKAEKLNPALARFDVVRTQYEKGAIGLADYISFLAKGEEERDFAIEQFLGAYEIEKTLNFSVVERERTRVMEKLVGALSKTEMEDLLHLSLAYKTGRIGFGTFYQAIKKKIQDHGVSLASTPSFDRYIQYVMLVENLHSEKLMEGLRALESRVLARLTKTPDEKQLMARSHEVELTLKLIAFALTPEEWEELQSIDHRFRSLDQKGLLAFENFYRQADIRSEKMVENLMSGSSSIAQRSPRILVSGGFHTPYVTAVLKKKGASFAVVQPQITKIETGSGSEYLSLFTQEKSRIDDLFSGEKLFLKPDMRSGTTQLAAGTAVYSTMAGIPFDANRLGIAVTKNGDHYQATMASGKAFDVSVGRSARGDEMELAPEGLPRTAWGRTSRSWWESIKSFWDRLQWPIRELIAVTPDGQSVGSGQYEWIGFLSQPLFSVTTNPLGGSGHEGDEDIVISVDELAIAFKTTAHVKKIHESFLSPKGSTPDLGKVRVLLNGSSPKIELNELKFVLDNLRLLTGAEIEKFGTAIEDLIMDLVYRDTNLPGSEIAELKKYFISLLLAYRARYYGPAIDAKIHEVIDEKIDIEIRFMGGQVKDKPMEFDPYQFLEGHLLDLVRSHKKLKEGVNKALASIRRGGETSGFSVAATFSDFFSEEFIGHDDDTRALFRDESRYEQAVDALDENQSYFQPYGFAAFATAAEKYSLVTAQYHKTLPEGDAVFERRNISARFSFLSDWSGYMAKQSGFQEFVFATPQDYLAPIKTWLIAQGETQKATQLEILLAQYFEASRATDVRSFIGSPNNTEPDFVGLAFDFFDHLKQNFGKVTILSDRTPQALDSVVSRIRSGQKAIVLGNEETPLQEPFVSFQPLRIYHSMALPNGRIADTGVDSLRFLSAQHLERGKTAMYPLADKAVRIFFNKSDPRLGLFDYIFLTRRNRGDGDDGEGNSANSLDPILDGSLFPVGSGTLSLPTTRERIVDKMKRWGWVAESADPSQKFSRPVELVIGLYASVVEVFAVFNPFGFYRAHDNPRWYQALGIAAIWAAMLYVGYIVFDFMTYDSPTLANTLDALLPSFVFALLGNIFAHAVYNVGATVLGYAPLAKKSKKLVEVTIPTANGDIKFQVEPNVAIITRVLSNHLPDDQALTELKQLIARSVAGDNVRGAVEPFDSLGRAGLIFWGIQHMSRLDRSEADHFQKIAVQFLDNIFLLGLRRFQARTALRSLNRFEKIDFAKYLLTLLIVLRNEHNASLADDLFEAIGVNLGYLEGQLGALNPVQAIRDHLIGLGKAHSILIQKGLETLKSSSFQDSVAHGRHGSTMDATGKGRSLSAADVSRILGGFRRQIDPRQTELRRAAWHFPLFVWSSITQKISAPVTLLFHPATFPVVSTGGTLPHSLQFQLDWLAANLSSGYRKIIFSDAIHIRPLFEALEQTRGSRSLPALVNDIDEYLKQGSPLPLDDYLGLPRSLNLSPSAKLVFKFWESVRDIMKGTDAEVLLFANLEDGLTGDEEEERFKIYKEWTASKEARAVVVGGNARYAVPQNYKGRLLTFKHSNVDADNLPDGSRIWPLIAYAASRLRLEVPPASHTVSVIRENNGLREVLDNADARDLYEDMLSDIGNGFVGQFVTSDSFEDGGGERPEWDPSVVGGNALSRIEVGSLTLSDTREKAVMKLVKWGLLPKTAEVTQKFSRPIELVIGLYASVVEVFAVFNPFGFYRAHDNPRWYQALGIAAIWAAMLYVSYVSFDLLTFDDSSIENFLYSSLASGMFALIANMMVHGLYNVLAVLLGLKPLTMISEGSRSFKGPIQIVLEPGEVASGIDLKPGVEIVFKLSPENEMVLRKNVDEGFSLQVGSSFVSIKKGDSITIGHDPKAAEVNYADARIDRVSAIHFLISVDAAGFVSIYDLFASFRKPIDIRGKTNPFRIVGAAESMPLFTSEVFSPEMKLLAPALPPKTYSQAQLLAQIKNVLNADSWMKKWTQTAAAYAAQPIKSANLKRLFFLRNFLIKMQKLYEKDIDEEDRWENFSAFLGRLLEDLDAEMNSIPAVGATVPLTITGHGLQDEVEILENRLFYTYRFKSARGAPWTIAVRQSKGKDKFLTFSVEKEIGQYGVFEPMPLVAKKEKLLPGMIDPYRFDLTGSQALNLTFITGMDFLRLSVVQSDGTEKEFLAEWEAASASPRFTEQTPRGIFYKTEAGLYSPRSSQKFVRTKSEPDADAFDQTAIWKPSKLAFITGDTMENHSLPSRLRIDYKETAQDPAVVTKEGKVDFGLSVNGGKKQLVLVDAGGVAIEGLSSVSPVDISADPVVLGRYTPGDRRIPETISVNGLEKKVKHYVSVPTPMVSGVHLVIYFSEQGDIVVENRASNKEITKVLRQTPPAGSQHASKFGWWMQAAALWALFATMVWLGYTNVYDPSGRWWGVASLVSIVLAISTSFVAARLPRGFLARTYNGEAPYYNSEVMFTLPLEIRRIIMAEETFHRFTTKRLQLWMDKPFVGFIIRLVDEFFAKTIALTILPFVRRSRFIDAINNPPFDYDFPRFEKVTPPSPGADLVAVSENGNVRAELFGKTIRIVWVRGGKTILELDTSRFQRIKTMELKFRGGGTLFITDTSGHTHFTNLNYLRQEGISRHTLGSEVGRTRIVIKGYELKYQPGDTKITLVDKDGNAERDFDLSKGLYHSPEGFVFAMYGKKLAYSLEDKVELFDPEAATQSDVRQIATVSSARAIWFADQGRRLIINTKDEGYSWDLEGEEITPIGLQEVPDEVLPPSPERPAVIPGPATLVPASRPTGTVLRKPFTRDGAPSRQTEIRELPDPSAPVLKKFMYRSSAALGWAMDFVGNTIEWVSLKDPSKLVGRYTAVGQTIKVISFHPAQPWIVYSNDKNQLVFLSLQNPAKPRVFKIMDFEETIGQFGYTPDNRIALQYFDANGNSKIKFIPLNDVFDDESGFVLLGGVAWAANLGLLLVWDWRMLGAGFAGLAAMAILYRFLRKEVGPVGKWLRSQFFIRLHALRNDGLTLPERLMIRDIQAGQIVKRPAIDVPVLDLGLNRRVIKAADVSQYQSLIATRTGSTLDLSLAAYLAERYSGEEGTSTGFDVDPTRAWPTAVEGARQLRIRMADPAEMEIDTADLVQGLRHDDVVVVYANSAARLTRPDDRIIRIAFENVSMEGFEQRLAVRDISLAQFARTQVHIAKQAILKDGVMNVLTGLESRMKEQAFDMFLLLPLNERVSAMVPITTRDLSRMVEFERLTRRLLEIQA